MMFAVGVGLAVYCLRHVLNDEDSEAVIDGAAALVVLTLAWFMFHGVVR